MMPPVLDDPPLPPLPPLPPAPALPPVLTTPPLPMTPPVPTTPPVPGVVWLPGCHVHPAKVQATSFGKLPQGWLAPEQAAGAHVQPWPMHAVRSARVMQSTGVPEHVDDRLLQ
jgi:hypothetical protein